MSGFRQIFYDSSSFNVDATSRLRVGQLTTLGDLKTLGYDDTRYIENVGTGTGTFGSNKFNMSVTSGQYYIRRSKIYFPYFSGKSQLIELTFDNFQPQSNVVKRVGYFSSSNASPYNSSLDGFWLESDGTTIRLMVYRNGTEILNLPWVNWQNYDQISSYNWQNSTLIVFDMMWSGGGQLRLFIKVGEEFVLAHAFHYAGTSTDTFILYPSQSVRYEIRSSTGTGNFRAICSQVSSEGSGANMGKEYCSVSLTNGVTTNTSGTTYPLKAIRKSTLYRHRYLELVDFNVFVRTPDQMLVTLQINPTLSAPLTFSPIPNSAAEQANGNGVITVTSPGTIVFSQTLTQNSLMSPNLLNNNFFSGVGMSIMDVSDQIVVCGTNLSSGITSLTNIRIREY